MKETAIKKSDLLVLPFQNHDAEGKGLNINTNVKSGLKQIK